MSVSEKTMSVILILVLFIVIADIYLLRNGGIQATISYWIYSHSINHPALPFAIGFLCGHLFWGQ